MNGITVNTAIRSDNLQIFLGVGDSSVTAFEYNCKNGDVKQKSLCPSDCGKVLCMSASSCGLWLAVLDDYKQLTLWSLSDLKLSALWLLPRCAAIAAFTPSSDALIISDKTGDVYEYKLKPRCEKGTLLLGHLSMLLDTIVSRDGCYIISSDRDEKIRVSSYPNCYNVQSYCLGHTEFVSRLAFFPDHHDLLVSGSGDGSCRIWKFLSGECVLCIFCKDVLPQSECSYPVVDFTCWKSAGQYWLAVYVGRLRNVLVYELMWTEGFVEARFCHRLQTAPTLTSISSSDDGVWMLFKDRLELWTLKESRLCVTDSNAATKISAAIKLHPGLQQNARDVEPLFKHYYDNMADYLDRKQKWMCGGKKPRGRGPPKRAK